MIQLARKPGILQSLQAIPIISVLLMFLTEKYVWCDFSFFLFLCDPYLYMEYTTT
jgi:hypothetical protein